MKETYPKSPPPHFSNPPPNKHKKEKHPITTPSTHQKQRLPKSPPNPNRHTPTRPQPRRLRRHLQNNHAPPPHLQPPFFPLLLLLLLLPQQRILLPRLPRGPDRRPSGLRPRHSKQRQSADRRLRVCPGGSCPREVGGHWPSGDAGAAQCSSSSSSSSGGWWWWWSHPWRTRRVREWWDGRGEVWVWDGRVEEDRVKKRVACLRESELGHDHVDV